MEKSDIEPLVQRGLSLRELADHFGYSSTGPVRRWLQKYELSAAQAPQGLKYSPDSLRAAAAASTSVAEVLRRIGASPTSHLYIKRRLRALEVDTSHFTQKRASPVNCRSADEVLVVLPEDVGRTPRAVLHRALQESGVIYKCAGCGNPGEWLGEPIVLEIDHVDGDWRNNRLENLRYLCPNCHAQTPTHRNRKRA